MNATKIQWCDSTFNPLVGCTKCSEGCEHCYAERMANRLAHNPSLPEATRAAYAKAVKDGKWSGKVVEVPGWPNKFKTLEKVKSPKLVFVESMGDLFHDSVDEYLIDRIIGRVRALPQHTFIFLTKRAKRMQEHMLFTQAGVERGFIPGPWPIPNLILMHTICDQEEADHNVPILLDTPAAARGVSIEPMLGAINLASNKGGTRWIGGQRGCAGKHSHGYAHEDGSPGVPAHHHHDDRCKQGLDWVIVGGESGPGARPMHPDWPRNIRDQCKEAGVPFFFKQWGEWLPSAVCSDDQADKIATSGLGSFYINHSGSIHNGDAGVDFFGSDEEITRIGKKAAGHLLDGETWQQFPEVA